MNDYYNINSQQFFDDTANVNMTTLYQKFLPLLPIAGSIIDAGCGSGRDSKYFKTQSYQIHAFDASKELADKASVFINQSVEIATFQSINLTRKFDGIWACASLLHVPKVELISAVDNLQKHLRGGGVFYMSFKYGNSEREHNGRKFTDMNEDSLNQLLESIEHLHLKETWITGDNRPGRESEQWLNAILIKRVV